MVLYNIVHSMYENMNDETFNIAIEKLRRKIEKGLIPNASISELETVVCKVTNNVVEKDEIPETDSSEILYKLQSADIDKTLNSLEAETSEKKDLSEEYLEFLENDLFLNSEPYGDLKIYENELLRKYGGIK